MSARATKQRAAVRQAVREAKSHPTANDVYELVRRDLPHIGLGTVYRNLERLVAEGEVRSVQDGGPALRFEGVLDDHAHFVCAECRRIFDLSTDPAAETRRRLAVAGYKIHNAVITLHGVCPSCAGVRERGPNAD